MTWEFDRLRATLASVFVDQPPPSRLGLIEPIALLRSGEINLPTAAKRAGTTPSRISKLADGGTVSTIFGGDIPVFTLEQDAKVRATLGQLLIGCALGARFEQEFARKAPRYMLAVALSVLIAMALAALSAWLLASLAGVALPTMVLATAPGGIAEMCITAKALQLGVPLVTAAHVTRVLILMMTTAPLFRLAGRLRTRHP